MARESKAANFVIASMQVEDRSSTHMLIDADHAVPRRVLVRFQLEQPRFFVRLEIRSKDGRQTVQRLEVQPGQLKEDGTFSGTAVGITTTNLRQLLIDRLVRTAMDAVRTPISRLSDDEREWHRQHVIYPGTPEQIDSHLDTLFRVPGETRPGVLEIFTGTSGELRGRGRETPADRIAKAAEIYRAAVAAGSSAPVKDVGIALGYSASQASRYLKAARERGLLDGVPTPGEIHGADATN